MRYSVIFLLYSYKCVQTFICKSDLSNCFSFRDSVAEWSAQQTCNVALLGFSPALARSLTEFLLGYSSSNTQPWL